MEKAFLQYQEADRWQMKKWRDTYSIAEADYVGQPL